MCPLTPSAVFDFFQQICAIPRESGNEQHITRFLLEFARSRGLEHQSDAIGNVVIRKPASPGLEHKPWVVLQSHTDMVCEKNADTVHDFTRDPIQTYVEGGWLRAKGTTLGADDGIGVAAQLAVLADEGLQHGPIECLFTVSEETGLDGARALTPDFLRGEILLNLDSEDEGELFIGCAGGIDTTARFHHSWEAPQEGFEAFEVAFTGLTGGHSGDDIDKGRANANQLLARFLWEARQGGDLQLAHIDGGNKRNAIAREARALCLAPATRIEALRQSFAQLLGELQEEYKHTEPGLSGSLEARPLPERVIDACTAGRLIAALHSCPHGVMAMSLELKGLVETSSNLASVKMPEDGVIRIGTSQRSALNSARHNAASRIEALFTLAGARVSHESEYPGWAPNLQSPITRVAVEAYTRRFGKAPVVRAIHAGLECGLFLTAFPRMDMISFGPTLRGVHSPDERLEIATVQKFWDLLLDILQMI